MPDFVWKAAQADAKIIEGRLQAASQAAAMQQLRAQGLTPLHITEASAGAAVPSAPAAADPSAAARSAVVLSEVAAAAAPARTSTS